MLRFPKIKLAEDGSPALIRRLLLENARQYARRYATAMALLMVVAGTTSASAWLIKDVVDRVFVEQNMVLVWVVPLVFAGLTIAKGIATYFSSVTLARVGNAIVADIQRRLYAHMLDLSIDYYSQTHSSDLVNRISHNANAARSVVNAFVTSFARDLLTVCGLVFVMVVQAPMMSLISFIIGPIAVFGLNKLVKRVRGVAKQQYYSLGRLIATMQETAQGIRVIKSFNLEGQMHGEMSSAIEENRKRADKMAMVSARATPLMETLGGIAVAGVMFWAGFAVIRFGETPGSFMAFIAALLLAYDPAKRLARVHLTIEAGLVGVRLMYDLLDMKPSLATNEDGPELDVQRGEIAFRKVSFAYQEEKPIFTGLDFRAEAGKMTALVGPSGAGKTTVIALIQRFYDPDAGKVTIDGQDIAGVQLHSLRQHIAMVSQDVVLFRGSVRDNIRLGKLDASDAEIEAAARSAQAHDFIMQLPDGYDATVGENGMQLSGGQRQRLAIARAMLRDAPIVLLDEATSALDTTAERAVQKAFETLTRGRTTIVIAHRLSTVQAADRICVMSEGSIVEQGTHQELLAANGQYAKLYRAQFANQQLAGDAAE